MVGGHGADQGNQFPADVFGHRFLVHLESQVVTALGGVLVERALEEFQGIVDLTLELFLAESEDLKLLAHKYTYIYAYFWAFKSAGQQEK
jgi:hypothetical protein